MEFEINNWDSFQKHLAKKLLKKKETQRLLVQIGIGVLGAGVSIWYHVHRRRYRRLCLKMAKLDHDISRNVLQNTECTADGRDKPLTFKKDLRFRYKLYLKLNKGMSVRQMKAEIEEMEKRRSNQ